MRKILFVVPTLRYGGAGRQMSLLAAGLSPERYSVGVCVLGGPGPLAGELCRAGVAPVLLGGRGPADVRALWRLRHLVRGLRPDVVHAFGLAALRAVACVAPGYRARVLASSCVGRRGEGVGWLGRWVLRRAERVTAVTGAQAELVHRAGVPRDKISLVPLAVARPAEAVGPRPPLPFPPTARFLSCVGPLRRGKKYQDAVWALDILRYLFGDLRLVIVGDGEDRCRLEQFVRAARLMDRVHFLGDRSDVLEVVSRSEAVLVPGAGVGSALDGMAVGRPVVGARGADLRHVVRDGETGLLVAAGDKAALARAARTVLEDPSLARRLGEGGRCRVVECHTPAALVGRYHEVYDRIAAGSAGAGGRTAFPPRHAVRVRRGAPAVAPAARAG